MCLLLITNETTDLVIDVTINKKYSYIFTKENIINAIVRTILNGTLS